MSDLEPFRVLTSRTVVMDEANIDTDQIIPARFLTTTSRKGLGRLAFHDWRYFADGAEKADFVLNRIDPRSHRVLVAGRNFGCGSSREHAPWALVDYGFRAVISTEIADIFTSNALKNGLLPVVVDEATHARLTGAPGSEVTIDLEAGRVRLACGHHYDFKVESFARECLLAGVDTLGWLAGRLPQIIEYEQRRAS
jgi:3-isopropylmalate/(R)-2-methylmalate dehydratase small subunit